MTDRELMQQALEALVKCEAALAEELAAWDIDPPLHHVQESHDLCGPAITALRERLAQPEQDAVLAEREACIDLVAFYGGPVDLEAAIRARGNT